MPRPKKPDSTIASALSREIFERSVIMLINKKAMIPRLTAPIIKIEVSITPVSIKASTTPGKVACPTASPIRLCPLSTETLPIIPAAAAKITVPKATTKQEELVRMSILYPPLPGRLHEYYLQSRHLLQDLK